MMMMMMMMVMIMLCRLHMDVRGSHDADEGARGGAGVQQDVRDARGVRPGKHGTADVTEAPQHAPAVREV